MQSQASVTQGAQLSEMKPAAAAGAPAFMSVAEASECLGTFSETTILRRLHDRKWPGGKSGRKWHLSRAFVDALTAVITSSPDVDVEDFAAQWMARHSSAGEVA